MESHVYVRDIAGHEGQEALLRGWLYGKRSSGKLHFLQVRGHGLELVSLRLVADGDVGFEPGLVAEQLVVVSLVRADGDIERRVQVHPGNIARVVVVREEGIGAQRQELLERRVVGERGSFPQESGRLLQIGRVRLVVRHDAQLLVGIPPDYGEESDGLFALRRGQRFDPGFELFARHIGRIEIRPHWLALRHAGELHADVQGRERQDGRLGAAVHGRLRARR